MIPLRFAALTWPISLLVSTAAPALGQNYPTKPIRIVTAEAGGGVDFTSRLLAQGLTPRVGQQVIVDNRAGAIVAGEIVSKAAPDGYTLLVSGNSLWLGTLLRDHTPYDPLRSFAPVTMPVRAPNVIVVHPGLAAKTVKDLIDLAKAKPGELNYASGAAGATNHLAAELFKAMAGINIRRIPYKSAGPALNDLMGGQVQIMFSNTGAVMGHVKSGRLRALAVTSAEPSALTPGLPTAAATGLPGYESASTFGMFVPARTPAALIQRLNQETVQFLNQPEVKERLITAGVEAVGTTPEELGAKIKTDMTRMGKVITDAGIRAE